jgi:ABC-type Fe3+-hydroxamate transport system substrate-binding protein
MNKFALLLPVLAALALSACDRPADTTPAASVETEADGSRTVQITVPEQLAPAIEAVQNPQATFNDLRNRAGTMTDQAKQDAVVGARNTAEAAARALGQTEAEITEAGDVAERSARDALGLPR